MLMGSKYPQYATYMNNSYGPTYGGGHDWYMGGTHWQSTYMSNHSYRYVRGSFGNQWLHGYTGTTNNSRAASWGMKQWAMFYQVSKDGKDLTTRFGNYVN